LPKGLAAYGQPKTAFLFLVGSETAYRERQEVEYPISGLSFSASGTSSNCASFRSTPKSNDIGGNGQAPIDPCRRTFSNPLSGGGGFHKDDAGDLLCPAISPYCVDDIARAAIKQADCK
jgi:hypothetical protein